MEIAIRNFDCKGKHFSEIVVDLPQQSDMNGIWADKIGHYILDEITACYMDEDSDLQDISKGVKSLRNLILRTLAKEIHPGTKPSIDFIYKILEDAYNDKSLSYDVSDLRNAVYEFASRSLHHADYCMKLVEKMKFRSEGDVISMNVKIINPEVLTNLYKNHGEFAHVCYDTSPSLAEKVGKTCADQGHMSGSRCEYIKFEITGIDRGTAEQCLRHEIGTSVPANQLDNYSFSDFSEQVIDVSPDQIVKNMASFRYIDKDGFQYAVPRVIQNCQRAMEAYQSLMAQINMARSIIKEALLEDGIDTRGAVQAANFVLPRATTTALVIGFTPEALIHFCHKRLCNRAQEFIRGIAIMMRNEVMKYNPQFAKELVPHCQYLLWCPEKNASCGMYPTRDELEKEINQKAKEMRANRTAKQILADIAGMSIDDSTKSLITQIIFDRVQDSQSEV